MFPNKVHIILFKNYKKNFRMKYNFGIKNYYLKANVLLPK